MVTPSSMTDKTTATSGSALVSIEAIAGEM